MLAGRPSQNGDMYPSIGDYAVIGDTRTAALVSRGGSIDWLCLPHFSGPAVFAALLDSRRGGRFTIRPTGPFTATRCYVEGTNVLETTFRSRQGRVKVTDLMSLPSDVPTDLQPAREVLRIVEGIEGEVELEIVFEPRPNYARTAARLKRRGALGWSAEFRDEALFLQTDVPLEDSGCAVCGRVTSTPARRRYLSLSYVKNDIGVLPLLGSAADERCRSTIQWWRRWARQCRYEGPYRQAVMRSALVLKLLTSSQSGAVVAAATTSLPEAVGGRRNWDYRYCWLRDASLTMRAFLDLGYRAEGEAFLAWLLHATRLTRPKLQVLYDIYGRPDVPEEELAHLDGYKGSQPVRTGNDAHRQLQLDTYGAVVLAAYDYLSSGGKLDSQESRLLAGFGETVCREWRKPDNGIWEIRGDPRQNTSSKLLCWVALDRLIRLHEQGHLRIPEERFRRERDAIAEAIEEHGFNTAFGSYVSEFGRSSPDASLLLAASLEYKPAAHARALGTFRYVRERLERNGLLHRYPPGSDGMPEREGAFGACSFWAVEYLARLGEADAARRSFKHLLGYSNDVGLFAEEVDPDTGEALGNFPQAFTHVGLINAAVAIERVEGKRE